MERLHLSNLRFLFDRAVELVHPRQLLHRRSRLGPVVEEEKGRLILDIQGQRFDVTDKRCHMVGFGKAVLGMAAALEQALGPLLKEGILSVPKGCLQQFPYEHDFLLSSNCKLKFYEGAENNQPDERALEAAKDIQHFAQTMTSKDILFVLITGGGSALLPLPRPPLTLNEKRQLLQKLANKGASIQELNRVRIALSDIKGGRLALAASEAHAIISLIISDIVGDPIHLIASGPTIYPSQEENTTVGGQNSRRTLEIIQNYDLATELSDNVRNLLERSEVYPVKGNNFVYLVGNNRIAVEAVEREAKILDYLPFTLTTQLKGSLESIENIYFHLTKDILRLRTGSIDSNEFMESISVYVNSMIPPPQSYEKLSKMILESRVNGKPLLLISAGEPTVKVTGNGLGGRNQELALRLSLRFHSDPELRDGVYFLSAGTDGIDGPTTAAGAIASSMVIEEFLNGCKSPETPTSYLNNNDSYNFYKNLPNGYKYHIHTGHTGTNVMDIHLLLICSQ